MFTQKILGKKMECYTEFCNISVRLLEFQLYTNVKHHTNCSKISCLINGSLDCHQVSLLCLVCWPLDFYSTYIPGLISLRSAIWGTAASNGHWILCNTEPIPDSKIHGANMGPSGANRTRVGPMLVPWTLLSGISSISGWFYLCTYDV